MKQTKLNSFLSLLFVLSLMLAACGTSSSETAAPATEALATEAITQAPTEAPVTEVPTEAAAPKALFQIIKADGSSFDVTLEAVKALPLAQVQVEGKMEEGPYLKDVLALAGVTEFTEVSLSGSSNPVTLTFEQVDDNTILDFNNHGTMKLASTYIPKADWTKDIAKIEVK